MPLRHLRAIAPFIACIACTAMAHAQSSDAAAIVARIRADRVRQAAESMSATLTTSTLITVRPGGSRIELVAPQTLVHEASGVFHRDPLDGVRIRIVAYRGTTPLSGLARGPIENLRALGEIVAIDDDRFVLLNTTFVSPLAADADWYYTFASIGVERRDGVEVDAISVTAVRSLRPLFTGRIYVARASGGAAAPKAGALVAMELEPSPGSAIPFVSDLHIVQTFSPGPNGESLPDSLAIAGSGVITFAGLGLAETHVDFALASRLHDRRVGAPMPDSLRWQSERIALSDGAADAPAAFWAAHSTLAPGQIATIETHRAEADAARALKVSFGGMIDYNRAGGATPTLSAGLAVGPIGASVAGGYSFGLGRPIGEGNLTIALGDATALNATLRGAAFSQISPTTTGDRAYPRIMNTLVAASLHQDYYDFFRKDGWSAGAEMGYGKLRVATTIEQSRQFSIDNNARWSLLTWTSKEFPPNPPITEGEYTTVQADVTFSRVAPFLKLTPLGDDDVRFSLTGMRGSRTGADSAFELVEALVSWAIPLVETGYNPIMLTLLGAGGTASASLPPQYQFRLRTSAATFGKPGGLVSPPKGLYGGTEYLALGAEINLTDLAWRAIGLPTVDGRGVELLLSGAAARYRQAHPVGYRGTGDLWYPEVGIGFSRIPLFITTIVYGRVDLRRGFGPLGRFGGNFTFVLPF